MVAWRMSRAGVERVRLCSGENDEYLRRIPATNTLVIVRSLVVWVAVEMGRGGMTGLLGRRLHMLLMGGGGTIRCAVSRKLSPGQSRSQCPVLARTEYRDWCLGMYETSNRGVQLP